MLGDLSAHFDCWGWKTFCKQKLRDSDFSEKVKSILHNAVINVKEISEIFQLPRTKKIDYFYIVVI